MNILVTGGFGFIGSGFIRSLAQKNDVDVIVNIDSNSSFRPKKGVSQPKKVRNFTVDINNTGYLLDILTNYSITHVVNFAELSVGTSKDIFNANVNGVNSLLHACIDYKKIQRLHHITTNDIFKQNESNLNTFTEASHIHTTTPYTASKAASNHLVQSFLHSYQLPVTMSSHSNVYGDYQKLSKLIPKTVNNITNNKKIELYGAGSTTLDWLHVDDHSQAVYDILTESGVEGDLFCIGSNSVITNKDLVESICKYMNVDPGDYISYIEAPEGVSLMSKMVDFTKIKRRLGWKPSIDLATGLEKVVSHYSSSF